MHRLANSAYLGHFLCCGLLRVAPNCVPGGISVVSIPTSYWHNAVAYFYLLSVYIEEAFLLNLEVPNFASTSLRTLFTVYEEMDASPMRRRGR